MTSIKRLPFLSAILLGLIMTVLTIENNEAQAETRASHFKLDNGLEVVVIPDTRAPVVTHMVWYRIGAADEPQGHSGIAHFLEHLMFKGTEEIPPGEFSKIVARNGGQDNAFTSQDATSYFQRVAKDRLPIVMKMEADRMTNLRLLEEDVLTERKVILEERRSRIDNEPSSILGEQMDAALFLAHPYGIPIIGWEHEMRQLSRQDALDFYQRFYAPNNAILVVAGDVTPEEVKSLALDTYGKVKPSDAIKARVRIQEPPAAAARRVELEDPRAGKATFQRTYLGPSYKTAEAKEAEALDLLMKVLGGGPTSRLYKKLVVEQRIASSAGGWFSGSALDSGRISVYGIAAGKTPIAEVEKSIDAVIADLLEKGVTDKELDRARNAYLADYIYETDSQSSLARRYGWGMVTGRTIEEIETWPDRLKKVTVEDLAKVARKYLYKKNSVTGVLRPQVKASPNGDAAAQASKS